jgi:hypothetical protein
MEGVGKGYLLNLGRQLELQALYNKSEEALFSG